MNEDDLDEDEGDFYGLLSNFISDVKNPIVDSSDLSRCLFSFSENGMWEDYVDSVSSEQAIMCWKIIEKLKREKFPENLEM